MAYTSLSNTHAEGGPPASAGGRLGDLVSAGRQLQMTVPCLLPGGSGTQDRAGRSGEGVGSKRRVTRETPVKASASFNLTVCG